MCIACCVIARKHIKYQSNDKALTVLHGVARYMEVKPFRTAGLCLHTRLVKIIAYMCRHCRAAMQCSLTGVQIDILTQSKPKILRYLQPCSEKTCTVEALCQVISQKSPHKTSFGRMSVKKR